MCSKATPGGEDQIGRREYVGRNVKVRQRHANIPLDTELVQMLVNRTAHASGVAHRREMLRGNVVVGADRLLFRQWMPVAQHAHHFVVEQGRGAQIFRRIRPVADDHIKLAFFQQALKINIERQRAHVETTIRHLDAKAVNQIRQKEGVEIIRRTDTEYTLRLRGIEWLGLNQNAVDGVERRARWRDERLGALGRRHAAAGAHQQFITRDFTQPLERAADGRLRDTEPVRRARHAFFLQYQIQHAQQMGVQRLSHSFLAFPCCAALYCCSGDGNVRNNNKLISALTERTIVRAIVRVIAFHSMVMTNTLRFLLNGKLIELSDVDPHLSLLDFVREHQHLTGTKEGCAEGDCGACTVVIGELTQDGAGRDRVALAPINACIRLLPTLDGKAVFTVESLKAASGALHPVQQAMVDCHGSQCGFCTPGFVMSLFALFKNEAAPTRVQTCDAIAGNLCRCTGYRPILDAAQVMYQNTAAAQGGCASGMEQWMFAPATSDAAPMPGESELASRLRELAHEDALHLKSKQGTFIAPRTMEDFSAAVLANPEAWILGGGTDIGLWVNKALQTNSTIIYTGEVTALKQVLEMDGGLRIGAAVSLEAAFRAMNRLYPELAHVWTRFASWPIRSSGTLGGNVANGSPIGDSMPALIAIGAQVVLRCGDAQRTIPLEGLYIDYKKQSREVGEWVEAILIPNRPSHVQLHIAAYKNSKRNEQDISAVFSAIAVGLDSETVAHCRIAYGGMAGTPKRAAHAEHALLGNVWNEASVRAAMDALVQDYQPMTDMRASAAYRMQVAQNLLLRFWLEASGEAVEARVF
jgi:xanthine dehydrogenase small subunit